MKSFLIKIFGIGTQATFSEGLNNSIRISNFVGLLFTLVIGIPFIIITAVYLPSLIWLPTVGTMMFLAVLPFNSSEMNKLSRVILCIAPITLANIYTAYLLGGRTGLPQGITLVITCFVVMPFALFEWHERVYSIVLAGIGLSMVVLQPIYEPYFYLVHPVSISLFEEPGIQMITTSLGIICIGGMMLTLVYRNSVLENKWGKN